MENESIILSIKPKYVKKILSGEKKFEYRRVIPANKVNFVYIYSSSPEKKVVGKCIIKRVVEDKVETLWSLTNTFSGILKSEFYNYFNDKSYGYAIELEVVERFDIPKPITDFGISNPPQSFCCLKNFNGKD